MLEVRNISKKYPGESLGAVNDVTFQIEKGSIQSFVGRSGSGKTTLLRMLAGLMKPDSGEILYDGVPYENPEEQLISGHPKVKLVFQDYQLKPNMTVAENIRYQLMLYDEDYQQERTQELLMLCGLASMAQKKPNELSGGQQQRLSLARALSEDPEALLMDEPFSSLDPMTKDSLILDLIKIVKAEGIILVLVTHDTQDALQLSDRIGFITRGELVQNDQPKLIYNQPVNLEVAEFFGPVNKIKLENEDFLFRPEQLKQKKEEGELKLELHVEKSIYSGFHYKVYARHNDELLCFYSEKSYLNSEKLYVYLNIDNMLKNGG